MQADNSKLVNTIACEYWIRGSFDLLISVLTKYLYGKEDTLHSTNLKSKYISHVMKEIAVRNIPFNSLS